MLQSNKILPNPPRHCHLGASTAVRYRNKQLMSTNNLTAIGLGY